MKYYDKAINLKTIDDIEINICRIYGTYLITLLVSSMLKHGIDWFCYKKIICFVVRKNMRLSALH